MSAVLLISVFLIAACGLIYELIAGTLASYLLGDSVFQFSTVIGSYLFAMGVGSSCQKNDSVMSVKGMTPKEMTIAAIQFSTMGESTKAATKPTTTDGSVAMSSITGLTTERVSGCKNSDV